MQVLQMILKKTGVLAKRPPSGKAVSRSKRSGPAQAASNISLGHWFKKKKLI
jgi:hypothetical protein